MQTFCRRLLAPFAFNTRPDAKGKLSAARRKGGPADLFFAHLVAWPAFPFRIATVGMQIHELQHGLLVPASSSILAFFEDFSSKAASRNAGRDGIKQNVVQAPFQS